METHPCECVMRGNLARCAKGCGASMETHPCECVMHGARVIEVHTGYASMETHPCECVMHTCSLDLADTDGVLQWRRTLASA